MDFDFLEGAAEELFGESWKTKLPAALGRDVSTMRRHDYRITVPMPVQAVVAAWLILRREYRILPPPSPGAAFTSILTGNPVPLADEFVEDLAMAARRLFGENWKTPMASALGVDRTSLWRAATANAPSAPIQAAIRAWMLIYRFSGSRPPFNHACLPSSSSKTSA